MSSAAASPSVRWTRPLSVSTSTASWPGPTTISSRPPGTNRMPVTGSPSCMTWNVRRRPGAARSTTLILPSVCPIASRRPSELNAACARFGPPASIGRPSRRVPARSQTMTEPSTPGRVERAPVGRELERRHAAGVAGEGLRRRRGADVPPDRVAVVVSVVTSERPPSDREARVGDGAIVTARRRECRAAAQVHEPHGSVRAADRRTCPRSGSARARCPPARRRGRARAGAYVPPISDHQPPVGRGQRRVPGSLAAAATLPARQRTRPEHAPARGDVEALHDLARPTHPTQRPAGHVERSSESQTAAR
jgi:hypothetical protein